MERTAQNPLTLEEMDTLASSARGFYGSPQPDSLKQAMLDLNPANPDDLRKLQALHSAHGELQVSHESYYVNNRIRNLLGLPQSAQQDDNEWYYMLPSMMQTRLQQV